MALRRLLLLTLLAGLAIGGCGSGAARSPSRGVTPPATAAASWPLVAPPPSILRLCGSARRQTAASVPVPCPHRIPRGVSTDARIRGVSLRPGTWEIGVNNGFDGTTDPVSGDRLIHWIVGAGTLRSARSLLLDARHFEVPVPPRVVAHGRVGGVPTQTLRYVEGAGPYGGHDVVVARTRDAWIWATLHGRAHDDVARAMLGDLVTTARLVVPGLRDGRPASLGASCRMLARTVGTDLCPTVVPSGTVHVDISAPLHGWARMFGIDATSPQLARDGGGRRATAGGHWTIEATSSRASRRLFAIQLHPNSASRPSRCRAVMLAGTPVTVCAVPGHEHGGGYYAGHVVAQWLQPRGDLGLQISAHGLRNRARVLAMTESAIRAALGRRGQGRQPR